MRLPATVGRSGRWIRDHYMTMDLRTLGLFRLVLGFMITGDLLRKWTYLRPYYSNEGVLTNHYLLFKPSGGHNFSLFNAFSTPGEVHVAFALSVMCAVAFWVGYRTRLFNVLCFIIVTSLDNRLAMVENGGYIVVNLLVGWSMFLPTGARFSVDAWRRSWAARREATADDLNERPSGVAPTSYTSLAVLLVQLNFAAIYFFNVVNKSGSIWRRGDTVHYVLHLDRMITGVAVFFRELLPHWLTRGISWSVLCVEALIVMCILAPYGRRITRPMAIVLVWALHFSFGIMMRLGPFAWFMMTWALLLLTPVQWDALSRRFLAKAEPRRVFYDEASGLSLFVARVLARLDGHHLLSFEAARSSSGNRPPLLEVGPGVDAQEGDEGEDEIRWAGMAAASELARALPLGRGALWLARVVTFGTLAALLRAVERHRMGVQRFFGLDAPRASTVETTAPPPVGQAPMAGRLGRVQAGMRELLLVYLGLISVSQILNDNKSVPDVMKHKQPDFVRSTLNYPRIFQGWGMFAPNPIQEDGVLAIDGYTVDGRRIDPLTGRFPDLNLTDSRGEGLGQIPQDYANRIRMDRHKGHRRALRDYLLRWHRYSGNANDELVAFDVYWVQDHCPAPGSDQPYAQAAIALLTWRKPGYRPAEGAPKIPPKPTVYSAEKTKRKK